MMDQEVASVLRDIAQESKVESLSRDALIASVAKRRRRAALQWTVVLIALATGASAWVSQVGGPAKSPSLAGPAAGNPEGGREWAAEIEAFRAAARYEVVLPGLQPGEEWQRVFHEVHDTQVGSFVQGDLWLRTEWGLVHIWESDMPTSVLRASDPVGQGAAESINGTVWWRVERDRPTGAWLSLATRAGEVVRSFA